MFLQKFNFKIKIQMKFILLLLGSTLIYAQKIEQIWADGNKIEKTITTEDYEALELIAVGNVIFTQGNVGEITLKGDQNIVELIKIKTKNNKLIIDYVKKVTINGEYDLEILVPIKSLKYVAVSGVGNVSTDHEIKTENLIISLDGVGKINLKISATNISTNLSTVGNIKLDGKAQIININSSGVGAFDGLDLEVEEAKITVSGIGSVSINCSKKLEVSLSGIGSIKYKGNPELKKLDVSGFGNIQKL